MSLGHGSRPVATLSQLVTYPLKSAAGISLSQAQVTPRGLAFDRRWMIVDHLGMLVTQRERAELAQLETALSGVCLQLRAPGLPALEVPLLPESGTPVTVTMWTEPVAAWSVPEASAWLASFLGGAYQLVYMPDATERLYPTRNDTPLSFADGNPFLLMSEASLADLNSRLETPVDLRNFRPNLVVTGCDAYAEDGWDRLQIGALELERLGPCVRCMLVNVDPDTSLRHAEPLRTLAQYRRVGSEVRFGQLYRLVGDAPFALRCGDGLVVPEETRGTP